MRDEGKNADEVIAGKLNIFQRTMLEWNDAAAYNAVHVVRVPAPLEVDRLKEVINRTVERRGLAGVTLDREKGTYRYHAGPGDCDLEIIRVDSDGRGAIFGEVERQLNTAFVPGQKFKPFRFFVVPEAVSFSLGLAYFHAVADAESFVLLMKEMVEAYREHNRTDPPRPANLYPPSFDNLLRHQPGLLARKLSAIPGLVRDMRRSSRPPYYNGHSPRNGFTFCSLEKEAFRSLTTTAKSWGVTLNDLLLGLLMKAIGLVASHRTQARKRRGISVGCIVNTRKDHGLDRGQAFGLFLGSFFVTHEVPEQMKLRELVADLHRQTVAIKRHKLYAGAPLEMGFARFMLSMLSLERSKKFYHRYYPLWGGVTNMNLNLLWDQAKSESPIDYFRAVSTSPAIPLVLSVTTVGQTMNLGFTHRSTTYLPEDLELVKRRFLEEANCLEVPA